MNVNETYIKMCEKAPELWDGRMFEVGDCIVCKGSEDGARDGLHIAGDSTIDDQLAFGGKWFTVFRKFQLQQMVKRDDESWIALENRFDTSFKYREHQDNWTPEQFWIAFVMKEKFNKQWDSGNWILAKTAK